MFVGVDSTLQTAVSFQTSIESMIENVSHLFLCFIIVFCLSICIITQDLLASFMFACQDGHFQCAQAILDEDPTIMEAADGVRVSHSLTFLFSL
jgi:hypothetical protein